MSSEITEYKIGTRKHDWETITREYAEGILKDDGSIVLPTQKELATKHGITHDVLKQRAARYRWGDQRNAYKAKLELERQRATAKELAGKAVVFNAHAYNTSQSGIEIIRKRFEYLLTLIGSEYDDSRIEMLQATLDAGGQINRNDTYGLANYKEMESLANALSKLHDTGLKALGADDKNDNQINVVTTVHMTPTEELNRPDPERVQGILNVINRKKVNIPSLTVAAEDVIDAELVEEGYVEVE